MLTGNSIFQQLLKKLEQLEERITRLEERVKELQERVGSLEEDVDYAIRRVHESLGPF